MPLIARVELQSGPIGYGILLALLGSGAVAGTFFLPKLRQSLNYNQLILAGAFLFAFSMFILALTKSFYLACSVTLLAGAGWMVVLATLTTVVQQVVPSWVRARALSIYIAIFFGGMTVGSIFWGWLAGHFSIPFSLFIAATGLVIASGLAYAFLSGEELITDQAPSRFLNIPVIEKQPNYEEGPVMVFVEYKVSPQKIEEFLHTISELRLVRLRDGAFYWSLFKDIKNKNKLIECFMVESWLAHLRQNERASISDRKIQETVNNFHEGKDPPRVTHFIAYKLPRE